MMFAENNIILWSAFILLVATAVVVWERWHRRERKRPPESDPYTEGLQMMLAGQLVQAAQRLTEAIRADTSNIDAYLKLSDIYRRLGHPRRSAQIHLELSERSELSVQMRAFVHRELATDWEQAGSAERAFQHLEKARKLDPSNPDILKLQMTLLEKQGRWTDAGEIMRQFITMTGGQVFIKLALYKIQEGEVLCAEGDEKKGRAKFKEALKIDPTAKEAILHTAQSFAREGRMDDALEWLSRFMVEYPDDAQLALPMLERLLYDLGRFGEIESIVREAVNNAPNNRQMTMTLIDLLTKKGEIDEAIESCERALEAIPEDIGLQLHRLRLLWNKKDYVACERLLDGLIDGIAPSKRGYFCRECGYQTEDLLILCPQCHSWRSFSGERRGEL